MLVSDFMSSSTGECTEDTPVEKVYELMQRCDQGFVVVIDSASHRVPIGVVSEHSICEQIIGNGRNPRGLTAGSVLDSRIRKVADGTTVEKLSKDLDRTELAAVAVVNQKGALCGVIPPNSFPAIKAAAADGSAAAKSHAVGAKAKATEFPGLRLAY